jgi:hypothetical protein
MHKLVEVLSAVRLLSVDMIVAETELWDFDS